MKPIGFHFWEFLFKFQKFKAKCVLILNLHELVETSNKKLPFLFFENKWKNGGT